MPELRSKYMEAVVLPAGGAAHSWKIKDKMDDGVSIGTIELSTIRGGYGFMGFPHLFLGPDDLTAIRDFLVEANEEQKREVKL
jgi:hypothetical protein